MRRENYYWFFFVELKTFPVVKRQSFFFRVRVRGSRVVPSLSFLRYTSELLCSFFPSAEKTEFPSLFFCEICTMQISMNKEHVTNSSQHYWDRIRKCNGKPRGKVLTRDKRTRPVTEYTSDIETVLFTSSRVWDLRSTNNGSIPFCFRRGSLFLWEQKYSLYFLKY